MLPSWAAVHPPKLPCPLMSYASPFWAKLHHSELCCTLLSCTATPWSMLHFTKLHSLHSLELQCTLLRYAAPHPTKLKCTSLSFTAPNQLHCTSMPRRTLTELPNPHTFFFERQTIRHPVPSGPGIKKLLMYEQVQRTQSSTRWKMLKCRCRQHRPWCRCPVYLLNTYVTKEPPTINKFFLFYIFYTSTVEVSWDRFVGKGAGWSSYRANVLVMPFSVGSCWLAQYSNLICTMYSYILYITSLKRLCHEMDSFLQA
jgi:hypothetical protein